MARVEASVLIRAPVDRVYALAQAVERFPEFMPDLERVTVLERRPGTTVTQWVGRVQGRKIRWIEEDQWDDARRVCTFRQRSGDFAHYAGTWTFEAMPDGTRTHLAVDYEIEIPLAGALLAGLVRVLMRKNCESMLAALKAEAESAGP